MATLVAVVAVAAAALPGDRALAARGGKGGGSTPGSSATLVASPNPALAYSSFQASGCGYTVGYGAELQMFNSTSGSTTGINIDSTGCFSVTWNTGNPGTYTLQVYEYVNRKWVLMSSGSLTVCSTLPC